MNDMEAITDDLARARRARIKVGIGGWNFPAWRANFYPKGLPQRRELEFASRHLTAIEINGTFYRAQKPAIYADWRGQTPSRFVFSLKAPRWIVGRKLLASAGPAIKAFVFGGVEELAEKLGPIVWQFPSSHAFERDDFAAFLELLPGELNGHPLRHVLEVRSASFLCDEYVDLARSHRLPSVFTDSGEYPNFADLTGEFVYARLMRSRESCRCGYTTAGLDAWAECARSWAGGGDPRQLPHVQPAITGKSTPRDTFIYFIGSAKRRNPSAAMALLQRVQA